MRQTPTNINTTAQISIWNHNTVTPKDLMQQGVTVTTPGGGGGGGGGGGYGSEQSNKSLSKHNLALHMSRSVSTTNSYNKTQLSCSPQPTPKQQQQQQTHTFVQHGRKHSMDSVESFHDTLALEFTNNKYEMCIEKSLYALEQLIIDVCNGYNCQKNMKIIKITLTMTMTMTMIITIKTMKTMTMTVMIISKVTKII